MLRTYVSRLRKTLEPDRAADESRAVIVSAIDRYLAFAVPKVGETALAAIEAITRELATSAQTITVTVAPTDGQLTTRGCGTWKPVK
ncbi:hypothetical protein AB0H86_06910 [Streptomyces sp. NPDC050997]|uniref:hypothetical protein n=1 Tax=Streptomyces sp. NPDC050997 TaxID=3155519 RepID=UPI00342928D4